MTPSLPIDLPSNTTAIEVVDPLRCAMLRFGLPCSNDAYVVLVCPMSDARQRLIPCCQMCIDDASETTERSTGATWIEHLERLLERSQP